MLRWMRVWLGWLLAVLGVGHSACTGDSFHTTPGSDGGTGAAEGGNPSGEAGIGAGGLPAGEAGARPISESGAPAGGTGTAGEEAGAAAGAGGQPSYESARLLDDMEDGDSNLLETNGDWYVLRDMSSGVITPAHGVAFTMTRLVPARGASEWAAQVQVAGFQGWGASFGFDFLYANMERQAYDLEDHRALRFWAKASQEVELKLQMPNVDTDPYGNRCSGTEGDNACYAHFTRSFRVGTAWREITVPFAELRQEGVGRRAESFDAHRVFSVFFVIGPKQDLTVAIDDVALLK